VGCIFQFAALIYERRAGAGALECYGVDRCLQQASNMVLLCLLDSSLLCLLTKLWWRGVSGVNLFCSELGKAKLSLLKVICRMLLSFQA